MNLWRRLWRRFRPRIQFRQLWLFGAYLLIIGSAFLGFRTLEHEAHQRVQVAQRSQVAALQEAHQRCLDDQRERLAVRSVVDRATASNGGNVDLTTVPGFDALPDSMQTYIRNLSRALSHSTTGPSLHDQLLALLPLIDC